MGGAAAVKPRSACRGNRNQWGGGPEHPMRWRQRVRRAPVRRLVPGYPSPARTW
jgi:hypothetical protein